MTAFAPEGKGTRQMLEALGIDASAQPIARARVRPQQEWPDLPNVPVQDHAA